MDDNPPIPHVVEGVPGVDWLPGGPSPAFPPCEARGVVVESGAGCGCGPKHLCGRFVKVVSAADCRACVSAADDTERGSELGE